MQGEIFLNFKSFEFYFFRSSSNNLFLDNFEEFSKCRFCCAQWEIILVTYLCFYELWAWGVGGAGQLGQGGPSGGADRSSPIQVTGGGTNYAGGTGLGQNNDAASYFFLKAAD